MAPCGRPTHFEVRATHLEENGLKDTSLRWKVSYNSDHGQPGPLAYKIDTLIINRRIEEAPRPIPRIIKLGSLNDICRELGISQGKNIVTIKNALHQNASAYITAKIQYRQADGTERTLEAGFTRYSVIFSGEKLPDGRKADGVYIILNDSFIQVINGAITRPLDYTYLKSLPLPRSGSTRSSATRCTPPSDTTARGPSSPIQISVPMPRRPVIPTGNASAAR